MSYQNFLKVTLAGLSIFTISCTNEDTTTEPSHQNKEVYSIFELGECTNKNLSEIAYVSNEQKNYTCKESGWEPESTNTNIEDNSSSSEIDDSSSSNIEMSLDEMLNSKVWMWSGNTGKAKVTISEREETSWLAYGDADIGGQTFFTWGNSLNWYGNDNKLVVRELSSYCNSICGTINFVESGVTDGAGNYYAGIGFQMLPMDITSWNGITVIYSSDMDLTLGIEEVNRRTYEYDDYRAKLPATSKPQMVTLTWDNFAQSGIGAPQPLENILKRINMVDLQYFSKTATQSNFKIYAIGKNI